MIPYQQSFGEVSKAVWNMDEAALKRIDSLLNIAAGQFLDWRLEDVYWTLRSIKREINAKLAESERQDIKKELINLEKDRVEFLKGKLPKGEFLPKLENFYEQLTIYMKEHGLFFREGDDEGL